MAALIHGSLNRSATESEENSQRHFLNLCHMCNLRMFVVLGISIAGIEKQHVIAYVPFDVVRICRRQAYLRKQIRF